MNTVNRVHRRSDSTPGLYQPLPAILKRPVARDEFLAELARRGHPRTRRWHESWIELGLIDRGEPEGRTGGGASFTWPYVQVEHADALLHKIVEGVALGSLAKYVVWTWLWWGDEWMPFRQIPRAMRTWADAEREAPIKNVRTSAKDLVGAIAHPRGTGTRRLVRALVDFPASGDVETLRDMVNDVFDPERTGRPRGPEGAALTTDRYLSMIAVRQRAAVQLDSYTQEQFRAARNLYCQSRAEYARKQAHYAADHDLGSMHPPVSESDLLNSASLDFLTCLGLLFERQRSISQPGGAADLP